MSNKILIVLTSQSTIGNTNQKTGAYLSEFTHPHEQFVRAGFEVDFASPLGGKAPLDGINLQDSINKTFMENPQNLHKIQNTIPLNQIKAQDYKAIYLSGGHGTVWDFPDNLDLQKMVAEIYQNGGVIGAVCHGVSGLVNVKLENGKNLVDGKNLNSFTNEEEIAVNHQNDVPFMLETRLIENGAIFHKSPNFESHCEVEGNLITGQNPQSAKLVGQKMLEVIAYIKLSKKQ
jgi:putative intracellular protease/amidase